MKRLVPIEASNVEILSAIDMPESLTCGVEEDERLMAVLEQHRHCFTRETWEAWRDVVVDYCSQHYREARSAGEAALHEATESNLRRAMALSWGASS